MTASSLLHGVKHVDAKRSLCGNTTWLELTSESGSSVSIFMPFDVALRMAQAFSEDQQPQPDPDAADFDDGNITP